MQGRRQRHQVGREQGARGGLWAGSRWGAAVGRAGAQEGGAVVGHPGHAGAVASLFVLHVHGHISHARPLVQPHVHPCAIQCPRVGARLRSRDCALKQSSNSLHSRDAPNSICPYLLHAGQEVEMVDGAAAPASALANGAASVGGVGGVADGAGQAAGSWTAVYVQMKDAETDTDYQ